jgi:hypothetical protein
MTVDPARLVDRQAGGIERLGKEMEIEKDLSKANQTG